MKFVLHTGCASPHVLPWARCVAQAVGHENFRYICEISITEERKGIGWKDAKEPWLQEAWNDRATADEYLLHADVLYSGFVELDLYEQRARNGLKTFYGSERWFKPIRIVRLFGLFDCSVPGWVRMFVPRYRKMAKRFVRWMNSDPNARCLTVGPWAKKDMLRIGVDESKIVPWGYFVAPSNQRSNLHCQPQPSTSTSAPLKVLWVGRMLHYKRVDTIIRAVAEVEKRGGRRKIQLTLVGDGPEKKRLQRLAARMLRKVNNSTVNPNLLPQPDAITFLPSQPIYKIRETMRSHDVYVLASNAQEGWGAALNEALEEGMTAIGTYEAGSSATILNEEWLFHADDWRRLATLLGWCAEMKRTGTLLGQGIGEWSAKKAAERLLAKLI